jgi:hypothetical protein
VRVAHEDGGLDGLEGVAAEGGAGTAAESVVHDLTALGVADQDNLGVGAALVEAVDSRDDGLGALAGRVIVADAAALGLAAAGRVVDGLAGRAGVGLLHHVDEALRGTVARRRGRLTGSEDVDTGARLPGLDLDGAGTGEASEDGEGNSGDLHVGCFLEGRDRIREMCLAVVR